MEFDFLLVTSWSEFDAYVQKTIADELEERGYRTAVITPIQSTAAILGDVPTQVFTLESITTDLLSVETIVSRFGIPNSRHICLTEQAYYNVSYDTVIQRLRLIGSRLDTVFSQHDFKYSYQGRGGELFRLLIHYRMGADNRHNIWNSFTPFDESVAFSTSLDGRWDTYEGIDFSDMTEEERTNTREYMAAFREDKKRYSHETPQLDLNPSVTDYLADARSKIQQLFQTDRPRNLPANIKTTLKKRINKRVNRILLPDISTSRELCENQKYVFFPLQFREESRLTVLSPAFYDQQWIVEYLARSLPHGVQLFIKQHPNHVGQESPYWIRRLSNKSNVRFLHPELTAHHAIEHADATVVTNNTVGFEALFYSSPLVVLGRAFYSQTPAAHTITDINLLPDAIADHLKSDVTEADRIASIYSLQQAAYNTASRQDTEARARGVASALPEFVADTDIGSG